MLPHDRIKQEKNKGKEKELAYSSSAKKGDYDSGALLINTNRIQIKIDTAGLDPQYTHPKH